MTKQYVVRRSVAIAAPQERVHALISDFREWVAWSPWEDVDPDLQRAYSGPERGVGAKYAWEGNKKAGKGNMTITEDEPGEIGVDLRFEKPFPSRAAITFRLGTQGEATLVEWRMTGDYSLATRIFALVKSMDSMIGPDFEKGLARLKAAAETA